MQADWSSVDALPPVGLSSPCCRVGVTSARRNSLSPTLMTQPITPSGLAPSVTIMTGFMGKSRGRAGVVREDLVHLSAVA